MKNTNYKISLFVLVFFFIGMGSTSAQEKEYNDNAMYLTYGNVIFASQYSVAYERTVYEKNKFRTRLKLNYGKLKNGLDHDSDSKVYENYIGLSGVFLYAILEANLGVSSGNYIIKRGEVPNPNIDYSKTYRGTTIYGNAGFRFENGDFLFRVGLGNLDLLYVGIGFTF